MQEGNEPPTSKLLSEPTVRQVFSGDLKATFLPGRGMLCASLRYRGVELLRRLEDLDAAAEKGSTAGIPLLYPWANRLAGPRYRAAGRDVELDTSSPLLHLDANGLPIHGVTWAKLAWDVIDATQDALSARLDWESRELLAVFPFRHRIEMNVKLNPRALTLETTVIAGRESAVPIGFGFHPYFGFADSPRDTWRLSLPAMRRLVLDSRGIPTGQEEQFDAFDEPLGEHDFDDCYAVIEELPAFSLSGADVCITVEFLEGYRYAQVFAPKGKDYVALEPMTGPTNALVSGVGLSVIKPGSSYRSSFRVRVDELM